MNIYKVIVAVNGRDLEAQVKLGIIATIETGTHENKVQTPKDKVNIIVGQTEQGQVTAWVQLLRFDDGANIQVTHEGWITEGQGELRSCSTLASVNASLLKELAPSAEAMKCQQDAGFGTLACCTSYGNGCYVTCCNSCCADPYGCPGASCCG